MNNGQWPIHYGYMQFSTEVSSRAQLVTDMKGKSFGVLGYKYSATTNWATAKPVTAPMSDFYNLKVESVNENGSYKYNYDAYPDTNDERSLKEWEEGNYSFFAYHPYTDENTTTGITLSTSATTNTPTLTYTYGWLNGSGKDWFKDSYSTVNTKNEVVKLNAVVRLYHKDVPVYDLMTAEAIDVNGTGSGTVGLNFKHRMFALEVLANNYNENTEGTYDAREYISGLVLTLKGLKHSSMIIPMSMQGGEEAPSYDGIEPEPGTGTRNFLISDPEEFVMVPAFNETYEGRGEGVPTSISKLGSNNGGYLMLIPQTTGLEGTLYWKELSNFPGTVATDFTSTIEFKAGRSYQLYINYVGSGITIALIEAGAWDIHDVEHKFE